MERYLSKLYAMRGRTEMTYGLSLGPRGQLRLISLSDDPRQVAPYELNPVMHYMQVLTHPLAEYIQFSTFTIDRPAPTRATPISSSLYLDPG